MDDTEDRSTLNAVNHVSKENNDKETGRIEAFSDGVFAVAITLLVLNIQPPHISTGDNELLKYIGEQWPMLIAFVSSFATIGVMWMNHHKLFTLIKRADNVLLALNLLLLLVIIFIPYPTALLAQQYSAHPEGHVAALLYTGTNVILAICFNLLWRYASHHNRLLDQKSNPVDVQGVSRQYILGPLIQLLIFLIAWISVPVAILLNVAMALLFAFPGRVPRFLIRRASR